MRRDDRGTAAITTVLLLPLLLTVLAGVAQIGALRVIAGRVSTAADLATLAAVDDQDPEALASTGTLRLAPDAVSVARRYFALNLAQLGPQLAVSPDTAAADADVAAFATPSTDPLTGWRYERPTVRLAASVAVRAPVLAALLMRDVVVVQVRAASAAR